jgi:hypothetical protein
LDIVIADIERLQTEGAARIAAASDVDELRAVESDLLG